MSLRRRKKRGKTKEEVRNKALRDREREEREQLSTLHESLLTSLVRGLVVEHTSVFEAGLTPHARIGQAECWHRVRGGEIQVALQERLWVLDEAVKSPAGAWTLVFPDPLRACGLSLPCQNWSSFVEYIMPSPLSWRLGMQVSTQSRIKAEAGHKRIARCHPVIFLISPARPNSTHISQANSELAALCSASYENNDLSYILGRRAPELQVL
ncbi:unnamed protein product [Pleuronectes platessa]|uniref:Uncharacterized protein n=1 Tax=Pleuronectes platessa TaxID=8262 RepID=A0A9N7TQM1_PLEPL|nr:unnamed protein product [Pleuronectes platessa]